MGKFQGSSESRFGSSGKDCFVVVIVVIDDDVVFFKISVWQHKLVWDYNKQESLVSYFLNNAAKTCLYGLKILRNIEIEHVFQSKGFVYFSWHPLSSLNLYAKGVYILLSPQDERCMLLSEGTDIQI